MNMSEDQQIKRIFKLRKEWHNKLASKGLTGDEMNDLWNLTLEIFDEKPTPVIIPKSRKRRFINDTIVNLLMIPPVIATLTPWMLGAVQLSMDQYIIWVSGGVFIQIPLNYVIIYYIKILKKYIPRLF